MGGMLLTVRFCVLLCILLERGAVASPAEGLRLLSKEIEYSAENTDRFAGGMIGHAACGRLFYFSSGLMHSPVANP